MPAGGAGRLSVLSRLLVRALEIVAGLTLLVLMAITVVDVFGRYLLNAPLLGAYELSELSIGVIVAAALPVVTLRGGHVRLTLFDHLLGRRGVAARDLASAGLMAAGTAVLAWRLWIEVELALRIGTSTDLLGVPVAPAIAFVAFTFALSAVIALRGMLRPTRHEARPGPDA